LRSIGVAFLVAFAAATDASVPAPKLLKFTVRKHPSIALSESDVSTILSLAGQLLNGACKQAGQSAKGKTLKKEWCELKFQLASSLEPMATLDKDLLRRNHYSEDAISAVKVSEETGLYGRNAIQAVIASSRADDGLQINIVRNIVSATCPDDFEPILEPSRVGASKRKLPEDGIYLVLGCSAIFGHAAVIRSGATGARKDKDWFKGEAALWAHEIAHLLGLKDLDASIVPRPGTAAPGWLMVHPYRSDSSRLFPEECDVLMHYGSSAVQRMRMEEFTRELVRRRQKAGRKLRQDSRFDATRIAASNQSLKPGLEEFQSP
jgi:hypothetical protein